MAKDPIILYGRAVQDARNRLRSAQISTMTDVLVAELFKPGTGDGTAFATVFAGWVRKLPKMNEEVGSFLDTRAAKAANRALGAAQVRADDFVTPDGAIQDIYAIGDMLRYVGEYFEFGGGGQDATVNDVNEFRDGLRNQLAFNKANRARRPVTDYDLTEWPDLGIFKNELLDRSVVKYMERFYGPYIGADISGTTTDALDVLAYFRADSIGSQNLVSNAGSAIRLGNEMVPIATMVLQYHHSLMECGLALSLSSKSMEKSASTNGAALSRFNLYDYTTFINGAANEPVASVMTRGNQTLARDLAGRGLVIIRDAIDINDNPYADAEIALLLDDPANNRLFDLNSQYTPFAEKRREVMMTEDGYYQNGNPSLTAFASRQFGNLAVAGQSYDDIIRMNSLDLAGLKGRAPTLVFDNLDAALQADRPGAALNARQVAAALKLPPQPQSPAQPAAEPQPASQLAPGDEPDADDTSLRGIDPNRLRKALAIASLFDN
ncbi:hypothetical protein [Pannonibacter tanglangensis]|uniref:Uncharacterized protein n=1 Tax=Pannonibacter tanglangensis TaxID=2750084 RepID=A0ABW9ZDT9_9HYPH|nr:hypothetical protein [Pannonibacter sp. XCT-34]NBN63008.1 hypothetical protein [Pannonibacter sp. XCT-34]